VKRIEPEEDNVLLLPGLNPIMAKPKRKPFVVRDASVPLVEVEPEKAKGRKPRIVRNVQNAQVSSVPASAIPASAIPASAIPASAMKGKPRIIRNQLKKSNL
jgi:hypothetical protein